MGRATLCIPQIDVAQRDALRLNAAVGCDTAPEAVVTAANPVDRRPEGGWRGCPTQGRGCVWSFFRVNSYSRRPASRGLTSLLTVLCFLGAQLWRAARSIQSRLIRPVPTLCYCSQVASRERRTWTTEKLKEPTLLSRFVYMLNACFGRNESATKV